MEERARNKGKKKKFLGVLNLLDVLILIFVVGIVVALFFKGDIIGKLKTNSSESQIEFTIRTDNVRLVTCIAVESGHSVYDSETGALLGVVSKVTYGQIMKEVELMDGSIILTPDPELYEMYVTVEGVGSSTPEGLFMNGSRIVSPGGGLGYKTKMMASSGVVVLSKEIGRN